MANMDGLRRAVAESVEQIANDALQITYRETVDAAPENTGALKQLIQIAAVRMSGEFVAEGTIECLAPYAGFTDAGTPPHEIPGNPLLSFFWADGPEGPGNYVFAHVNHPGTTGTDWWTGGVEDGEPMRSRWEDACGEAAAG